ncbi:putative MFS family arabinose efflux permease [Actinomadura pelletieri DSM 43383]|uniref:Putative MFS family arabinose efflux permease n=1 Tax=Actinomadura pelletieri DSM 43383 TaxID=1120940 RepID=A0A495QSQ5_9ACTN|nr:MFS transporter [Actinomadura pelletieri]RKS76535.1 putative MFS family arabinose efflux permease [Actinomadura pelletieri DSM 43383]
MTSAASGTSSSHGGADDSEGKNDSWRRDFNLLLGGSALSQLGTLGAAAANPLLALALTDSPIIAGWAAAASTLPGLFLHLPVGLLVDHYDRKRIMLISQLIRVANSVLLFIGLCALAEPWPILIVAAVIDGSCAVFFRLAEFAAVRFVVPDGEAESAMAKNEARHHVALVFGRPLGGFLFTAGRALPYILDALTSLISVVSILLLKRKNLQSFELGRLEFWKLSKGKAVPSFKEGMRRIRDDEFLRTSLGFCTIANVGFQIIILVLVVEAERQRFSGTTIGLMLATSGICGVLGALTATRVVRWRRPRSTVRWSVTLWAPCLVIVAFTAEMPLIGIFVWGACSLTGAYINVALAMHQSRVIPQNVLGRVEGVAQFLTTGAVTLGASVAGYVIEALGTRVTAALVAVVFVLIAVGVWSPVAFAQTSSQRDPSKADRKARAAVAGDPASGRGTMVRMGEDG